MLALTSEVSNTLDATCLAAFDRAAELAVTRGASAIALGHFLLALLDDPESDFAASLRAKDVDPTKVRAFLDEVIETIPRAKKPPRAATILVTKEVEGWLTRSRRALGASTRRLRSAFLLEQLVLDPLGGQRPLPTELDARWVRDQLAELRALPTAADRDARIFDGLREEAESGGPLAAAAVRPAIGYRYFRSARTNFGPVDCDVCGTAGRGSTSVFGSGDIDEVCESCIQEGKLAAHDATLNSGDALVLAAEIRRHDPALDAAAAKKLAKARTLELETRTPHPEHWQEHEWPIHCGDYCAYQGEIGVAEISSFAGDEDPKAFLQQHVPESEGDFDAEEIWPNIRPAAPTEGEGAYDTGVYHYTCLGCGRAVLLWDCN